MSEPIDSALHRSQMKHSELGQAAELAKAGRYDLAILALKALLQREPENEIGLGLLAAIYLQIGYKEKALELYEKLLEKNADNPLARFQSGLAHFNAGSAETALEIWKPLLDREDDFMAHFHGALALLGLDRPAEAEPLLLHASRVMPPSHPLYPALLELTTEHTRNKKAQTSE